MYSLFQKTKNHSAKTPEALRYVAMDKYVSYLKGPGFSFKTARILLMSVGTIGMAAAILWSLGGQI